jgi:hypothetical protein
LWARTPSFDSVLRAVTLSLFLFRLFSGHLNLAIHPHLTGPIRLTNMNMPPDNQDSVYLSMEAYKQHHKKRKFSSSTPHKRSDSDDIVCMGAHLGPFAQGPKQKSWPSRPAKLEIHVDDVEPQNSAGDLAVAPTTNATRLAPVIGRSRGGSRSMTTLAHPPDDLYWSKEDFAQYVAQRDRDQGRGTRRGTYLSLSRLSVPRQSGLDDCLAKA